MLFRFVNVLIGLAIAVGLALIPANIAKKKGRSFGLWLVFGFFFFLIALICSLVISDCSQNSDHL